jgi:hypothetical protein
MISFRVSEHEFEQLRIISESAGAGSLSDYARLSLCGKEIGQPLHLAQKIHQLDGDLQRLCQHVERLTTLMENTHTRPVKMAPPEA